MRERGSPTRRGLARGPGVTCAALAIAISLAIASPAHASAPALAIAMLNAERAADGIPAGIVEVPAWSAACAAHNAYERANGGALTHVEDASKPGYTAQGAWAGQHSVLAAGVSWATGNPWGTAPIHLAQLLAPRLASIGIDDASDLSCATTFPGYTRADPPTDVAYTSPGAGRTGVATSEFAAEGPYTPGQQVGIPIGTATGPYLYVMFDGPGVYHPGGASEAAKLTAATLTGPTGAVPVRIADNTTAGLAGYLPSGGQVIPLTALRARTTYTARVTGALVSDPARRFARTWSFTTGGSAIVKTHVELGRPRRRGAKLHVTVRAGKALRGRHATLTLRALRRRCGSCAFVGSGPATHKQITLAAKATLTLALPRRGRGVRVSVKVASLTVGDVHYRAASASVSYRRA